MPPLESDSSELYEFDSVLSATLLLTDDGNFRYLPSSIVSVSVFISEILLQRLYGAKAYAHIWLWIVHLALSEKAFESLKLVL